jgi:hypothetical protein
MLWCTYTFDGKRHRGCDPGAAQKCGSQPFRPACTTLTGCPALRRSPARNNQTVPPAAARLQSSNPHLKYYDNYKVITDTPADHTGWRTSRI